MFERLVALSLAMAVGSCGFDKSVLQGADFDGDAAVGPDGAGVPASCAELVATDTASTDGTFTLYFDGDGSKPWTVYCADMDATPSEYLELVMTGADLNFSQYTAGGSSPGTDVRTNYTRVRIDPATYSVDISDQRFSSSTGSLTHNVDDVISMPYGVAMDCNSAGTGLANINLQGTPFAVDDTFCQAGFQASGSATFSENDQVVTIDGGGGCGWTSPAPCPHNPYNSTGGSILGLTYVR